MQWTKFEWWKGSKQKLPKEKSPILVAKEGDYPTVLGYLKYAAGDKESPQVITPDATCMDRPKTLFKDGKPHMEEEVLYWIYPRDINRNNAYSFLTHSN